MRGTQKTAAPLFIRVQRLVSVGCCSGFHEVKPLSPSLAHLQWCFLVQWFSMHAGQPKLICHCWLTSQGALGTGKQMQKGNPILLQTLSPTKAAQWTKGFLGGSRDVSEGEGDGLSGRAAQWWNVSQRNICRLMWWKDRGMLESGCPGLGYLPGMWSSASLFISFCLSFLIQSQPP